MRRTGKLMAIVACMLVLPTLLAGLPAVGGAGVLHAFPDAQAEKSIDFTSPNGGSVSLPLATLPFNSTVTSAGFRVSGEQLSVPEQNYTLKVSQAYSTEGWTSPPSPDDGNWFPAPLDAYPRMNSNDSEYFSTYSEGRPFQLLQFNVTHQAAYVAEMTVDWTGWGKSVGYQPTTYSMTMQVWNHRSQRWTDGVGLYGSVQIEFNLQQVFKVPYPEYLDSSGTVFVAVRVDSDGDIYNVIQTDLVVLHVKGSGYSAYPNNVQLKFSAAGVNGTQPINYYGEFASFVDIGKSGALKNALNMLLRNVTGPQFPAQVTFFLTVSSTSMGRLILTFDSLAWDRLDARLTADEVQGETGARVSLYGNTSGENISQYFYDYGDGSDSGWVVNSWSAHAYNRSGTYDARLMVKHVNNEVSRWSEPLMITVLNRAPRPFVWATTSSASIHDYIGFDSTGSMDPDGSIIGYQWEFGDGSNSTERAPWHLYDMSGEYTVTLTVTDDENATASATLPISVKGIPPVVDFQVIPRFGDFRTEFRFVSLASDPDGTIKSWLWEFGDGSNSTEKNATHRYSTAGTYIVTLTCADAEDMTAYRDGIVVVKNVGPKAIAAADRSRVLTGDRVNFASTNSSDPDGSIQTFFWDFGDGTYSSSPNASHQFSRAEAFTVKLTVTDNAGATSTTSLTVVVENRGPTARMRVLSLRDSSEPVLFDGTDSSDADGKVAEYRWNFGDGSNATGKAVAHKYRPGTYNVNLLVVDDRSATDTIYMKVVVPEAGMSQTNVSPLLAAAGIPVALFVGLWLGRRWKRSPPPPRVPQMPPPPQA